MGAGHQKSKHVIGGVGLSATQPPKIGVGLEMEFRHMANDSTSHTNVMKPQ